MIETKRRARKCHKCDLCSGIIRKGQLHIHETGRIPTFDDSDDRIQLGIKYLNLRRHLSPCEGVLKYMFDFRKYLRDCTRGNHSFVQEHKMDGYCGGHQVWLGTGDYYCEACGVDRKSNADQRVP